jgi:uncharacterized membrane protein YdjX (TVP38/TMEM64 family)
MNRVSIYKNARLLIRVALLIALLIIFVPRLRGITAQSIAEFSPDSLLLAFFVFLGIYALKTLTAVVPIAALYVAGGVVFPWPWALLVSYAGVTVSMAVGYFIGARLGEDRIDMLLPKNKRIARHIDAHRSNPASMCFALRLLPVPFDLFSMLCGAIRMPPLKYWFLSLLGISPKLIPFTLVGTAILTPLSADFLVPFAVCLALSGTIFAAYKMKVK